MKLIDETKFRTPAEAKAWIQFQGISVAEFARQHGFGAQLVREVLAGRKPGTRGQSHKIAVVLGIKRGAINDQPASVDNVQPELRTAEQAKEWFNFNGMSVAEFARTNGFSESLVGQILNGHKTTTRGQVHNIAIALGIKHGVLTEKPGRFDKSKSGRRPAGAARRSPLDDASFEDLARAIVERFNKADKLSWKAKALSEQGKSAHQLEAAAKAFVALITP